MQSRNWTSVGSSQQKESRLLYFGRRGLRLRTGGRELIGHPDQLGQGPGTHFSHHLAAMDHHRCLAYTGKRHRLFGPWRWARPFILRKNPTSTAGARRRPGSRKPPRVAPACDRELFLVRKYFPSMPENGRAEDAEPSENRWPRPTATRREARSGIGRATVMPAAGATSSRLTQLRAL
jgi:hypothetical protein